MELTGVTYRSRASMVLAIVTAVACGAGIVLTWLPGDVGAGLRYSWPFALVGAVVWVLFWNPRLTVEEHGITIVNPLRTHFVPWPAIRSIETKYAVTLETPQGRISVWATPAPGRHTAAWVHRSDFTNIPASAQQDDGRLRPSDAVTTTSGSAAYVIRTYWEQLRDAGLLAHGVEPGAQTVRWHVGTIAALTGLLAASVIGLVV